MPISLWMLHLIKNTAGDTGIQEAEGVKEKRNGKERRKCDREQRGNPDVM